MTAPRYTPFGKFQVTPHVNNILWLTKLVHPFPTNAGHIIDIAKQWHFSQSTLDFLNRFRRDDTFQNAEDFITRSEELELLLHDEQDMPAEILQSPQD